MHYVTVNFTLRTYILYTTLYTKKFLRIIKEIIIVIIQERFANNSFAF